MFTTHIHWIPDISPWRLGLMPRPRGGEWLEDEVAAWRAAQIDTVVSLLEPHEVRELDLRAEASLCEAAGIRYASCPIPDRGTPTSLQAVVRLTEDLASRVRDGRAVAIHCRAGIGRAGLITGCVMLQLGVPFDNIFAALSRARGVAVPDTPEQAAWLRQLSSLR